MTSSVSVPDSITPVDPDPFFQYLVNKTLEPVPDWYSAYNGGSESGINDDKEEELKKC